MTDQTYSSGNEPQPEQRLHFVTFSGPRPPDNAETRRRIRSHAQPHHRHRIKRLQQRVVVELSVDHLLEDSSQGAAASGNSLSDTRQRQSQEPVALSNPITLLDAGRSDPFASFNVDRNRRSRQLWDHIYDGSCAKFRSLIAIGFIDLVRETIAISQMLSAAAWHLVHHLKCEDDRAEDARYSVVTTHSLQKRLEDPVTCTTDEVIVTVLTCAAYANLSRDSDAFNIHMAGLMRILDRRGGRNSLESSTVLRMALFWIELNGCFRQDIVPQFLAPYHILANFSKITHPISMDSELLEESDTNAIEDSVVVNNILRSLKQVQNLIDLELSIRDLWQDISFFMYNLSPILHRLLSFPRVTVHDRKWIRQRECFRLAAILENTSLREKFDPDSGSGMLYGSKLQMMLNTPDMLPSWDKSNSLLIWVLAISAVSPCLFQDLRNYFMDCLSRCLEHNKILSFEDFAIKVKEIQWSDSALGSISEAFRGKLQLGD